MGKLKVKYKKNCRESVYLSTEKREILTMENSSFTKNMLIWQIAI